MSISVWTFYRDNIFDRPKRAANLDAISADERQVRYSCLWPFVGEGDGSRAVLVWQA